MFSGCLTTTTTLPVLVPYATSIQFWPELATVRGREGRRKGRGGGGGEGGRGRKSYCITQLWFSAYSCNTHDHDNIIIYSTYSGWECKRH